MFTFFMAIHARHKKPLKSAVVSMTTGVAALAVAAYALSVTVNIYTVFAALTLGVPGAVLVAIVSIFA
ncbi:MAG: pro-sigmaK processing inhibitor BofA family protein [Oscillospiraceae bacterium]|nr:pro-sigmaK processing inhibitor BofA family protein [Oscillospiraceae bacterium]